MSVSDGREGGIPHPAVLTLILPKEPQKKGRCIDAGRYQLFADSNGTDKLLQLQQRADFLNSRLHVKSHFLKLSDSFRMAAHVLFPVCSPLIGLIFAENWPNLDGEPCTLTLTFDTFHKR